MKTINEAIVQALNISQKPITAKEIFRIITENKLYTFNSENPYHIMLTMLRRHSYGLDFSSSSPTKLFQLMENGTYWIYKMPINDKKVKILSVDPTNATLILDKIKIEYEEYVNIFKSNILAQLKLIDPYAFEYFAKGLLKVYGFKEVKVTKKSKDGGIDGYGKLKVGISNLNVAFQCKRWANNNVGRHEIDKFRGAIQGEFEQGIIFTTSKFSYEAQKADIKRGAVPIIMIDGTLIVDYMIEKKYGIDIEQFPIFINALDQVLSND